jgi:hypothetical protein
MAQKAEKNLHFMSLGMSVDISSTEMSRSSRVSDQTLTDQRSDQVIRTHGCSGQRPGTTDQLPKSSIST